MRVSSCLSRNTSRSSESPWTTSCATSHITSVACQTAQRVSALRRVAGSLDSRGILTLQGTNPPLYGVRCLEMDVQSPYPHRPARRGTEARSSSAGGRRGGRGKCHVTGAPEGRGNSDGVPQDSSTAHPSPHPSQPAPTPTRENDEASSRWGPEAARLWNQFMVAKPAEVTGLSTHQTKVAANVWRGALPARLEL